MKRRVRKIANFFAFNLLFFALYLNFIHKDKSPIPVASDANQQKTAAFSGIAPVTDPEKYLDKKSDPVSGAAIQQPGVEKSTQSEVAALKLSVN